MFLISDKYASDQVFGKIWLWIDAWRWNKIKINSAHGINWIKFFYSKCKSLTSKQDFICGRKVDRGRATHIWHVLVNTSVGADQSSKRKRMSFLNNLQQKQVYMSLLFSDF